MEIYRRVLDIGYSSNCSSWEKWDTSHSFSQYSSGWIRDSLDGYWRFMNHLVRIHVTWHARGDITCKCRLGRGYDILMACRQVEAFTFHRTRSINPRDFLCLFSFFSLLFLVFSRGEPTGIPATWLKGDAPRKPVPGPTNRSLLSNHRFR